MATVSDTALGSGPRASQLRRRHRRDRTMTLLLTALMIGIGALLVWILAYVAIQGLQALDWGFLTDTPPGNPSDAGGGFYNGIVGSFIIVGIATLAGGAARHRLRDLPQPVRRRAASPGSLRLVTDVMLGIPTIVTGAFIYALWVVEFGFSGYAGAFSLGARDGAADRARHRGDAAARAARHPRGEPRARRNQVPHHRLGPAPHGGRRDHHRRDARRRARDG